MTRGFVDEEQVRRVSRTMALRKVAQAEDVARQVVVLSSDELSGHITGQVDHGRRRHGGPGRPRRRAGTKSGAAGPPPRRRMIAVSPRTELVAIGTQSLDFAV